MAEEKLDWLKDYREPLKAWKQLLGVAETAVDFVRKRGYQRDSYDMLEEIYLRQEMTEGVHEFTCTLLSFVEDQVEKLKKREFMLGSSEIIESMIGKYKFIAGEHTCWGITGIVLSMAGAVGEVSCDVVKQALEVTPVQKVKEWCKKKLNSIFGKKKNIYAQEQK